MTTPFISEQDLSDKLGRDVTADDGATIAVDAACEVCRDIAQQTFNRVTTTEVYDGTGRDALNLREVPVNSVTSVSVYQSSLGWTTAGTADYTLNGSGVLLATNTAGTSTIGTTWPLGRQNVQVTYNHGYTAVPTSVRAVALAIAERLVVQGPSMFETVGSTSVRYAAEETAVMPTERMILRLHKPR